MEMIADKSFIEGLPKAELHVHIEGTLEPSLMFEIAKRNGIQLKHKSVEELKAKYDFKDLQEFLDLYYEGANVLLTEQDFYDLTWAYLQKIQGQNVVHTEIFFDPQTHTQRGVPFETALNGIKNALANAKEKWGITSEIIPNFLRHLSEEDAMLTFSEAMGFREDFVGFGLDSSELGHPPAKFIQVFGMVREEGLRIVAHAGEEGPAEYIRDALDLLNVSRIDHGIRAIDDENLMRDLAQKQIPLTVCPLSNIKLKAVADMNLHPLKKLLDAGLVVTINSDDPAYFGGYINENYLAAAQALQLTRAEVIKIAQNSFNASFAGNERKAEMLAKLDAYCKHF